MSQKEGARAYGRGQGFSRPVPNYHLSPAKEELRKKILPARQKLENSGQLSGRICRRIFSWEVFKHAGRILSYCPVRGEADISPVNDYVSRRGVLYLPAVPPVQGSGKESMRALRYGQLAPGRFGIPSPPPGNPEISPEALDLVLVPGIVFDKTGGRLGFGSGFYDDFLKDCAAPKAGVCFRMQVVENVPHDLKDVRMDFIVTEDGISETKKGG